ncbi:MAG: carboxypeptidase-like regulatory domain-containing protein, partial [Clostridiales bacterium]|nr:carboxypeptidase-like regulatory domain-containing protein [Clostridiales bacterium]
MTKLRNKIVLALLALCLAVTAVLFVACGGDDSSNDANVTYTVTVNKDGAPVKGVKVTVKNGALSYAPKTTSADGKVTFKLVKSDDYTVELSDLPEGYEVPAGAAFTFSDDRSLTVNLAEKFAYKVKLVNPDGSPFTAEGVSVGICINGNCLEPVEIDETGLARIDAAKNDYHIKVFDLPAGYAYECDGDAYAVHQTDEGTYIYDGDENTYVSLSATVNEQTVTIYPVNVLDFATMTAMTDAEIDNYNDDIRKIDGYKAYKIKANIAVGETAYYTFTADINGYYDLYAVGYDQSIMGYKINPNFLLGDTDAPNNGWNFSYIFGYGDVTAVKGNRYYVNVTNRATTTALELEFIVATPAASSTAITGATATTTVKAAINKAGANAVIALTPAAGASYRLTLQGEGAIKCVDSLENAEAATFADGEYEANAKAEYKFTEDLVSLGYTAYFAVSVKGEYPAAIDVRVDKVADLADTYNTKTTPETLATYDAPEGTELMPVPLDGTAELVLGNDGYYHYGTTDGPVVMVILTEQLDSVRFRGGAVAYIEYYTLGVNPYVVDVTTGTDAADLSKGKTYDDYRELLRGFKDYKYDSQNNAIIPNPDDITVEKYYAKYVNEDGACPLTADLKNILQIITNQILANKNLSLLPAADDENVWMFACYYYGEQQQADPIVGEYECDLGETKYVLTIDKNGSFNVKEVTEDEEYTIASGAWNKSDGGEYSFSFNPSEGYTYTMTYADGEFTYDDGMGPLVFAKAEQTVTDAIVGEYAPDEMSPNQSHLIVS